mmetsp:Transcript_1588/g.4702  ORF Transcript_1588/g.4702 Transcript_1588/m.4702 type:complete len:219 (+) Transcript_1588:350-1006(+)
MVALTLISRVSDGLPLAEGLDSDKERQLDSFKQQAKTLFKKQANSGAGQPKRMTLEAGSMTFHYIISGNVCYLAIADQSYPKRLAFEYLEELKNEFETLYAGEIESATRPYAFIRFDTFIQKTKKLYQDTRTQRNIAKLNTDISEVHQIMTRNIAEVLERGERLDSIAQMSTTLAQESKMYSNRARELQRQALIRKYMPFAVVGGIALLLLLIRLWRR